MGSAGKRYPLEPVPGKSGMTDHRNNGWIRKTGGTQMTADHKMPAYREGYAGSTLPGHAFFLILSIPPSSLFHTGRRA